MKGIPSSTARLGPGVRAQHSQPEFLLPTPYHKPNPNPKGPTHSYGSYIIIVIPNVGTLHSTIYVGT